jgi:hypothetical protein
MENKSGDTTPDWLIELEEQSKSAEPEMILQETSNPFWLMVAVGIVVISLIVLCFAISWWT